MTLSTGALVWVYAVVNGKEEDLSERKALNGKPKERSGDAKTD